MYPEPVSLKLVFGLPLHLIRVTCLKMLKINVVNVDITRTAIPFPFGFIVVGPGVHLLCMNDKEMNIWGWRSVCVLIKPWQGKWEIKYVFLLTDEIQGKILPFWMWSKLAICNCQSSFPKAIFFSFGLFWAFDSLLFPLPVTVDFMFLFSIFFLNLLWPTPRPLWGNCLRSPGCEDRGGVGVVGRCFLSKNLPHYI